MREVIVGAMVALDGVMQAPGGPEEDPTGGFTFGGWVAPYADVDPVFGEEVGELFGQPFDLLLGRRTYDIFAAYRPFAEGGSYDDIATAFNRQKICGDAQRRRPHLEGVGRAARRRRGRRDTEQEDGPALVTQGSTELVHSLLAAGLVDEIRAFTFPLLLGNGKRLFADNREPRAFTLSIAPYRQMA